MLHRNHGAEPSLCWTVAPTSDQIVSDILALPKVLEKIIEGNGCVVPDEFLRSGRRERRADDEYLTDMRGFSGGSTPSAALPFESRRMRTSFFEV